MARELQKPTNVNSNRPDREEVSRRAYQIFLERGCPEGCDLDHWLEAEAQLAGVIGQQDKEVASAKTAKAPVRQSPGRRV